MLITLAIVAPIVARASYCALFVASGVFPQTAKPAALQAMEEARKSLSGEIKWTVRPNSENAREMHYVSRFARNGDWIFENRGDQHGWTAWDGFTDSGVTKFPQCYMCNSDGWWSFQETGLTADWWKGDATAASVAERVKDVRAVGTLSTSGNIEYRLGLSAIWGTQYDAPVVSWHEERRGALYVVAATDERGAETTWHINPDKDWNAERVTYSYGGQVQAEAVCELRRFGTAWFPARTDYYQRNRLLESVVIESAQLNQPNDKGRFTLADMGAEAGTNVWIKNLPAKPGELLIWNGDDVTSSDRWFDDVDSGKREPGPTWRRIRAGESYSSPYETDEQRAGRKIAEVTGRVRRAMNRHQTLWEIYVRTFIERYKLNDAQSQEADQLLAKCQERANAHLDRNKARWTTLQSKVEVAAKEGKTEEVKKLTEEIGKLAAPLEEIFEKQLKPGLDKIPTRAQRKAVEEAEQQNKAQSPEQKTQPATRPAADGGKRP